MRQQNSPQKSKLKKSQDEKKKKKWRTRTQLSKRREQHRARENAPKIYGGQRAEHRAAAKAASTSARGCRNDGNFAGSLY